jgi:hypothetical protein
MLQALLSDMIEKVFMTNTQFLLGKYNWIGPPYKKLSKIYIFYLKKFLFLNLILL